MQWPRLNRTLLFLISALLVLIVAALLSCCEAFIINNGLVCEGLVIIITSPGQQHLAVAMPLYYISARARHSASSKHYFPPSNEIFALNRDARRRFPPTLGAMNDDDDGATTAILVDHPNSAVW